jgi:hypothetical protein
MCRVFVDLDNTIRLYGSRRYLPGGMAFLCALRGANGPPPVIVTARPSWATSVEAPREEVLHGRVVHDFVRPALRAVVDGPWCDETGHFMSNFWHTRVCVAMGERKYQNITAFLRANGREPAIFVGDTSEGDVHAAHRLLQEGWIMAAYVRDAAVDPRLLSCCVLPAHRHLYVFRGYDEAAKMARLAGYISAESCQRIRAEVASAQQREQAGPGFPFLALGLVLDVGWLCAIVAWLILLVVTATAQIHDHNT